MTYEELVAETGAEIGIEGFAPDADGVCVLASDIGEIMIMDCKGPREMVLLSAAVADVPPDADAALLEALKANRGFRDTNGATLSVDAETNHAFAETAGGTLSIEDGFVYFEQCLPLHLVERSEGETVVKAFIANALEWRRRIDNMGGEGDGVQQFDGLTV